MAWEFQCPIDGCEFSASGNEQGEIVEDVQQHTRDKHGDTWTREEVEEYIVGPG